MICPAEISNRTADICIGNVLISSPEMISAFMMAAIMIAPCILGAIVVLKNNDVKGEKGVAE